MRLLITGASGFVGSNLISYLNAKGHSGFAVSRQNLPSNDRWQWIARSTIEKWAPPAVDALIHLEVKHHVENPGAAEIRDLERVNVEGTNEWLRWAGERNVSRFVLFSSIKAAGPSASCQDETVAGEPDSPYGRSKLRAEKAIHEWVNGAAGRSAVIVRPAVIYGPGNRANMFALVDAIYRGRFFLIGRNDNRKSLVSIRNVTAAVDHLLGLKLSGCNLFYLTDRDTHSVAEIAAIITELLEIGKPLRRLPSVVAGTLALGGDILKLLNIRFPLNSQRLKALLETTEFSCQKLKESGFVHPQSTREGLAEMVNWYLKLCTRIR